MNVADDGICPKCSSIYGPLRNVHVHDCVIRSRSSAIKFGSNTDLEMSNLLFENIVIWDSNRGLGIQQRSAGNITNVTYRNISIETRYTAPRWWGNGEPIWITSEPRTPYPTGVVGFVSNITFQDIRAVSENGALITGRNHTLHGITLERVSITIKSSTDYLQRQPQPPITLIGKDYRPAMDEFWLNRIPSAINGIRLEEAGAVVASGVSVQFDDSQSYYGDCVSMDPATSLSGDVECSQHGFLSAS